MRRNVFVSVAVALFTGLLPVQSFFLNRACYAVSVSAVLTEAAVVSVTVFVISLMFERILDRVCNGFASALLTAVLVYAYLESGILSAGIPTITGDFPEVLNSSWRKILDSLVAGFVVALPLVFFRRIREWIHWIALAVCLLGFASVADMCLARNDEGAPGRAGGLLPFPPIARGLSYSPVRNVLMFVLDNASGKDAADILARDPELAGRFPGFVAYQDNVGMHDGTKRGVPGLLTGEYFEKGNGRTEYVMSAIGPKSFLRTYQKRGAAVYSTLAMLSYGFTTEGDLSCDVPKPARRRLALLTPANEVPYFTLTDLVLFRTAPFAFKGTSLLGRYRASGDFDDEAQLFWYEHILCPVLAQRPVSSDPRQVLGKFHMSGAHPPFYFDCNGKPYADPTAVTPYIALSNALVQLSRLMDEYQRKGIYKDSLMVIASDHGPRPTGADGEPTAHALLWIKPEGDMEPIRISDLSTTHAKVSEMMKVAADRRLRRNEIEELIVSSNRLFRCVLDDSHFNDFWFGGQKTVRRSGNFK